MKNKKITAIFLAMTMVSSLIAPVASLEADAAASPVVVLGDSVSTGYGLPEGSPSYVTLLEQEMGYSFDNYAQDELTTAGLLEQLQTNTAVQEAVQGAEVVLVTIGANDILQPVLNNSVFALENYNSLEEMMAAYTTQIRIALQRELTATMPPVVETANQNMDAIIAQLQSLNSEAEYVFQTVYDPASIENDTTGLPDAAILALNNFSSVLIYQYLEGSRNLSTLIPLGLNENLRNKTEIHVVDTYNAFLTHAWTYTNISSMDVHPNTIGHALIAENVLATGLLPEKTYSKGDADGDGSVTVEDAVSVLTEYANVSAGNAATYQKAQFAAADIDANSSISVEDAVAILTYYAKQSAGLTPSWDN